MRKLVLILFLMGSLISPAEAADGPSGAGVDPAQSCAFLQDAARIKNCVAAFDHIPNKQALAYTLAYMQANTGQLADSSCLRPLPTVKTKKATLPFPGTEGMTLEKLGQGIKNTCQFVVNDVQSKYKGNTYQSNSYFVDLCDPKTPVTDFYMNKGTGTAGYSDTNNAHTTNVGAYLTGDHVFHFTPYDMSPQYKKIQKSFGYIPAVFLYGAQSTNNDTSNTKPFHASGYKSSWGCPSTDVKNEWMMEKLAANGPSLVMNYGPSSMSPPESTTKCDAIPETDPNQKVAKSPQKHEGSAPIVKPKPRSTTKTKTPGGRK